MLINRLFSSIIRALREDPLSTGMLEVVFPKIENYVFREYYILKSLWQIIALVLNNGYTMYLMQ